MLRRKCEICGSTEKVFFFRRKIMLCEKHYAQNVRKEKRELRESAKIEDLPNEIWKDIKGYETLYQVSNLGRVKSLPKFYQGERILKSRKDRYGYLYIGLIKSKIKKSFKIHRLVAEAFISNPNNYPIVNHKDENKLNNKSKNLEWCTAEYNNMYNGRAKKAGEKNRGRKNTKDSIERMKISAQNRKGSVN